MLITNVLTQPTCNRSRHIALHQSEAINIADTLGRPAYLDPPKYQQTKRLSKGAPLKIPKAICFDGTTRRRVTATHITLTS